MAKACDVVVLGGGNAAGYVAKAAVEAGIGGRLTIIGEEAAVSYERPALSKAYLFPEGAPRLPGFHTCVGGGGARQELAWYAEQGVQFLTGTRVTGVDIAAKILTLADGRTVTYNVLVIATGARAISLSDFGAPGAGLPGVHTLRGVADADALLADVAAAKAAGGGQIVCVGGGYIGAETAAGLSLHGLPVTVVLPEDRLMARIMPPEVAAVYEKCYEAKGIRLVKGATVTGFQAGPDGRVASVDLKDGRALPAAVAVVGVGARPNAELFEGQLQREAPGRGGLVVDGAFRCHPPAGGAPLADVYAIGDVAAFPLLAEGGKLGRQEHVTHARSSAAHAVAAIAGKAPAPYDYLPYFYSRVFTLSWQFFGRMPHGAQVVPFGVDAALAAAAQGAASKFGAFWLDGGRLAGVFVESASPEEAAAARKLAAAAPAAPGAGELAAKGAGYLLEAAAKL